MACDRCGKWHHQRCCKSTFNANEAWVYNLCPAKRQTKAPSKYEYTDLVNLKFCTHGRKRDFRQFTVEVIHQLVGDSRFQCLKRGRPSTALTLPTRITQSSHFPVKGEGVDHWCLVCAEKHSSNKKANPTTTYGENHNKKVKTSFKCCGGSSYLCLKKDSTCWQDWHTKMEYWH